MQKTEEQRFCTVRDYYCGAIGRARRILGLLIDDFFSRGVEYLTEEEKYILELQLIAHYDVIEAVLNTVNDILFTLETDLDAASGIKTRCTEHRKNTLCCIYGLTEDTAPVGEHPTADGPIHPHKERTSDHEG